MRSQLRFVMHSSDELEFAAQLLVDESVLLVDGPRWTTPTPKTFRSLADVTGRYCIIWSTQDRASLSARYIPTCNDWYCESESVTIQFLRSQIFGSVITEGSIAIGTSDAAEKEASGVERRFKSLVRFVKKHYTNSAIQWSNPSLPFAPASPGRSANPSKPDAQLWIGPHALRWLRQDPDRCVKQSRNFLTEARLVQAAA